VVTRVLICDEVPLFRDGLRTLLDAEPDMDVVDTTDSGIHAMVLVRTHRPHVVVTGLSLQGMSGLELTKRLTREDVKPSPRVVILSMNDSNETVADMLDAGANGFLVKSATREELRSAIQAAASGETMLAPSIAKRLVDWYRRRDEYPNDLLDPQLATLTHREREVLTLVARGMSTEEMAGELCIGVTTVRTHVYRLRCKLDVRDRAQLVSFAFRAGLMRPA
jgi:DNA-binding NarL/FixJ family response regulator